MPETKLHDRSFYIGIGFLKMSSPENWLCNLYTGCVTFQQKAGASHFYG